MVDALPPSAGTREMTPKPPATKYALPSKTTSWACRSPVARATGGRSGTLCINVPMSAEPPNQQMPAPQGSRARPEPEASIDTGSPPSTETEKTPSTLAKYKVLPTIAMEEGTNPDANVRVAPPDRATAFVPSVSQ